MTQKQEDKLTKRLSEIITLLTDDKSYYLNLLEEFQIISDKLNFKYENKYKFIDNYLKDKKTI